MSDWERIEKLDPGRTFLNDCFMSATPAYAVGVFWVDMEEAHAFIQRIRESQGLRLTYLHLLIRACGIALAKYPKINAMIDCDRRIVHPARIDIGVSVEGTTNFAPVVVLTDVNKKDLHTLAKELGEGAKKAKTEEAAFLRKMNWVGRLLPFRWLRRMLIRLVSRYARVRRSVMGNFQITSVNEEMIIVNRISTSSMMSLGHVRERPAVIEGKVVPRKSAYLCLPIDHRVLDGITPMKFAYEVIRLMENPNLLTED
jgi:pyruvate/2-oxoglutarate dehydrogenase complex dihydrolipoamide acyltransferase (E2) component